MNTRTLITTTALFFGIAGSAFAQEATVETNTAFAGQSSRAEVRIEAQRALAAGELHETAQINPVTAIDSDLSRPAVRIATVEALKAGTIADLNAEAFNFS